MSELKKLITVTPEAPIINLRDVARIRLEIGFNENVSMAQALDAMIKDIEAGQFSRYDTPSFVLRFEDNQVPYIIDSFEELVEFYSGLGGLDGKVMPFACSLFDNKNEGDYRALLHLNETDNSFLQIPHPVTVPRRVEGYLHPIIDAELDEYNLLFPT